MGEPPPVTDEKPVHKLLGSPRLKLRVGLASALLLAVGVLIAPPARLTTLSAPDERAAPLFEEQARLREPEQPFRGVQDIAGRVSAYSVAIPAPASPRGVVRDYAAPAAGPSLPAGFGVIVSAQGDVLTHAAALQGRFTVQVQTAGGLPTEAILSAYEPETGLALLQLSPAGEGLSVPVIAAAPAPGALVLAAAGYLGRTIAVPAFVTSVSEEAYALSEVGASMSPGTPVYDVDGRLVGVVVVDGETRRVFPAQPAVDRLSARVGAGHQQSIGVALQPLAGPLTGAFGETGALVSDVVEGGPADTAGVRAGDVLLAVAETAIDSPASGQRAIDSLEYGERSTLRVRRDARRLTLTVTASSAFEVAARARPATPAALATLPEARALAPAAELQAAGIPPTARVLRINGRPVASLAQALQEIRRPQRTAILYLQHEGVRFFAAAPPAP